MITLDTLRAAALSAQPWIELDKLVRAELAAGRLTRAIYDEIMSLDKEVSDTPGYTEDSHDAIGDTLDALIGFCRADCAYKNPPILPTEEEIATLPRWARVAFAARCARRVLPLCLASAEPLHEENKSLIVFSVTFAESNATIEGEHRRQANLQLPNLLMQLNRIVAQSTVSAVLSAVKAAVGEAYRVGGASLAPKFAVVASDGLDLRPMIRRDFDHLSRLAEWQEWDDDTPVPPEVFGPLWPEGPPKGWPPITDVPQRALVIEAFARERATEQMIEDIVNLFNALNRYHIARSGIRLTLEQFQSLLPAFVTAEV